MSEKDTVVVNDLDEYNKRSQKIQNKIDACEMAGLGTSEYEKYTKKRIRFKEGIDLTKDKLIIKRIGRLVEEKNESVSFCLELDLF